MEERFLTLQRRWYILLGAFLGGLFASLFLGQWSQLPPLLLVAASSLLLFGIPAWIYGRYTSSNFGEVFRTLGLTYPRRSSCLPLIALIIAAPLIGKISIDLTQHMNEWLTHTDGVLGIWHRAMKAREAIQMTRLSSVSPGIGWVVAALLPAFCEELFMRGALQPLLIAQTRSRFWGIFLVGLIFALIHAAPAYFPSILLLSIYFSYVRELSGSIWLSFALHLLNNTLALLPA